MIYFSKYVDVSAKILEAIASIMLFMMIIHIVIDVFLKYFLNFPMPDTTVYVAYYYMVGCVFLPLAFVEKARQGISVDILYDRLPAAGKIVLAVIATVSTIAFFGVLGIQSLFDAIEGYEKGEFADGATVVYVWPGRFLMPVGFAVGFLVLVLRLVEELRGKIGQSHEKGSTP